jgi:hypothetical protein
MSFDDFTIFGRFNLKYEYRNDSRVDGLHGVNVGVEGLSLRGTFLAVHFSVEPQLLFVENSNWE